MRKIHWLIVLLALALAACGQKAEDKNTQALDSSGAGGTETAAEHEISSPGAVYKALTIDEFAAIVEHKNDQYTIVNVHIPYEGEIEGTDMRIPYNDLPALTSALPDKNAPIVLYCRSGRMSKEAADQLVAMGYTQLWDVSGGMVAWQSSGRNLVDKE